MNSESKNSQPHLGIRVSYDGKFFEGFQSQSNSKSVQQYIEKAFRIFLGRPIRIQFGSRTDSGVHAYDQIVIVAHGYSLYGDLSGKQKARFLYSLNALMEERVSLWEILKIRPSFNLKTDIDWKEYEYKILLGPTLDPLMKESLWWIRSPLDVLAMKRALKKLKGRHDFSGFATKKNNQPLHMDNRRTILDADLLIQKHQHMKNIKILTFRFRGDGFLYRMVRNMAGALVEVGRGQTNRVEQILAAKARPQNLMSAPAQGLSLVKSHIAKKWFSKISAVLFVALSSLSHIQARDFSGSASLGASQRFFNDEKLGHVNGFSEWGAIQMDLHFGLYEFPYGIEPIIGFNYIKNSASLYALDADGNYVLDSDGRRIPSTVDRLDYQLMSVSYGLRYKAWQPDFFVLIPYAEALQRFCYGRVKKVTYAVDQQKINTGYDLGFEFGTGVIFSFLYDESLKADIRSSFSAKDFGLMTSVRYLSAGFFKEGLGLLTDTGGWSFGASIYLDW